MKKVMKNIELFVRKFSKICSVYKLLITIICNLPIISLAQVIIIGNAGVGKTCLSYRFCNGKFPDSTEATIGVDFRERCLAINDELIRVQLVCIII
jgi:GTPase SAR1 family protein